MTEQRWASADPSWNEYGADEWADAAVGAMALGGIERLYFCSGSELSFYQEAVARARSREWPAPKLVTMVHEGAALNAAIGDAMVSGQPAATAAHVDVGTFNYGAGLHTAWRGGYPVLITAGTGPAPTPARWRAVATTACSGSRSPATRARSFGSTPSSTTVWSTRTTPGSWSAGCFRSP